MELELLLEKYQNFPSYFLKFEEGQFEISRSRPKKSHTRKVLAELYLYSIQKIKPLFVDKDPNALVRTIWKTYFTPRVDLSLPRIIREDSFLSMYAQAEGVTVGFAISLFESLTFASQIKESDLLRPIRIGSRQEANQYFDVDAAPPGFFAKVSIKSRLRCDRYLLDRIQKDLIRASGLEDHIERRRIACAILSFSAAYREIDGVELQVPHFEKSNKLVTFECCQHLIAEGVKTFSMVPREDHPPIYLCEGTELWPSQPLMFGSILANFAEHGSATEAYAHSWRRIHKQLRDLAEKTGRLSVVTGHSMGGAMAVQIALYSHDLIEHAFAFNPPLPGERDAQFYQTLEKRQKKKFSIIANLDDVAFWRIGEKLFGEVTLFLAKERWTYFAVHLVDLILFVPAVVKFLLNVNYGFPSHERVIELCEDYVSFQLSEEEIAIENEERKGRFDYLSFLPRLYDPLKVIFSLFRRFFKWRLEEEYLQNEIEIIALHERDLMDTMTEETREQVERELQALHEQKTLLQNKLFLKQ